MTTPLDNEPVLIECHACGKHVLPTANNTCPHCGFPLQSTSAVPVTQRPDVLLLPTGPVPEPTPERGSALFGPKTSLILHVQPGDNYLTLSVRHTTRMGRGVGTRSLDPEDMIDLTEFGAYRYGVSRYHCQLQRVNSELQITDLGSSNGTFLSDKKLPAHRPFTVCDGDLIRLGALALAVSFSPAT